MVTKKAATTGKKLTVGKDKVKDLKVQPGKGSAVKGGGQRYKSTQNKTATDPNCPC